jgi:hypothetical protein
MTEEIRNRAKCNLCGDLLESFHRYDLVECKCGEIAIDGGPGLFGSRAKDYSNFIRVDDLGNELPVKYQEVQEEKHSEETPKPLVTRQEKIEILKEMRKSYERLPPNALHLPISHADYYSLLLILESLFEDDWKSDMHLTNLSNKV